MKLFTLPDLGEGIPEAEIHQWHVKEGDIIERDTVLVSMETAKAVVDVPAPFSGTIQKCFGQPGDIIRTGEPLVGYLNETDLTPVAAPQTPAAKPETQTKTLPAVRVLANQLGVDLNSVAGTGKDGLITPENVKRAAQLARAEASAALKTIPEHFEPIKGVRRAMAQAMSLSRSQVCPVTLMDEADISAWQAGNDITLRVIRAIRIACEKEPALNAWFDGETLSRRCHSEIHLGIAMDSEEGLFVPVLRDLKALSPAVIRQQIDQFKQEVKNRSIAPELLRDPTITLSNFGVFAGRYATPVVVPPTVAIIGTGRIYHALQCRLLPLSLTVDHRACTGGEAARFLQALLVDLANAQ